MANLCEPAAAEENIDKSSISHEYKEIHHYFFFPKITFLVDNCFFRARTQYDLNSGGLGCLGRECALQLRLLETRLKDARNPGLPPVLHLEATMAHKMLLLSPRSQLRAARSQGPRCKTLVQKRGL